MNEGGSYFRTWPKADMSERLSDVRFRGRADVEQDVRF